MHATTHTMYRGQTKLACKTQFSSSIMWVPGPNSGHQAWGHQLAEPSFVALLLDSEQWVERQNKCVLLLLIFLTQGLDEQTRLTWNSEPLGQPVKNVFIAKPSLKNKQQQQNKREVGRRKGWEMG